MIPDDPPHLVDLYSSSSTTDAGGGAQLTYTLVQSGVPCLINQLGTSTRILFDQRVQVIQYQVGILSSLITTQPKPGWQAVCSDTQEVIILEGIQPGRVSYLGTIEPLTYLKGYTIVE